MPNSGPSKMQVERIEKSEKLPGVKLVKVDDTVARKLASSKKHSTLSETFGKSGAPGYVIGPGDTLEVTIWETAPAILFRRVSLDPNLSSQGLGGEVLPPQLVTGDGTINIPFVGRVKVAGRSPATIEREIVSRLEGQANNPQALVRVSDKQSAFVSVIGAVNNSRNVPLTPRGEKLLDALAEAGGVSEPLNKVTVQLSRKGVTGRMPLDKIVEDPKQNLILAPGDVVAALFQPWTYSVLGATGRNQEVPFEAGGISLAQALSRTGGLNDTRANPGGIFVFRFEDPAMVDADAAETGLSGSVPVVYQVDFNDPTAFFATQNFPMQDKDVLYVANMPAAELEKFLRMVGMVLTPTLNLGRYQLQVSD